MTHEKAIEAAVTASEATRTKMDAERESFPRQYRERATGPGGYWEKLERAKTIAAIKAFLGAVEPSEGMIEAAGDAALKFATYSYDVGKDENGVQCYRVHAHPKEYFSAMCAALSREIEK